MDKNFVLGGCGNGNGGGLQLPIGFRFRPTDEELILHYLKPKVHLLPVPAFSIPEVDEIFQSHPSHLPGDVKERRYFFCKRKWDYLKTCGRSRINNISDGSGYWKEVGKEKVISIEVALKTSYVVGIKKSFVFYQGKHPRVSKTSWFMHEYRLVPSEIPTASTKDLGNWVAYSINERKRKARAKITSKKMKKMIVGEVDDHVMELMSIYNSIEFGSPPLPSPLCSSTDEEET